MRSPRRASAEVRPCAVRDASTWRAVPATLLLVFVAVAMLPAAAVAQPPLPERGEPGAQKIPPSARAAIEARLAQRGAAPIIVRLDISGTLTAEQILRRAPDRRLPEDARQRIREWTRALDEGAEAVVITATGCGAFVQDYGRLFADDVELAGPARRVAAAAKDIGRVLAAEELPPLEPPQAQQTDPLPHSPAASGRVARIRATARPT